MSSISTPPQIAVPSSYMVGSPIGPATTSEPQGIAFADVMRIVKQRFVLILVTAIILYFLIGLATLLIWLFAPAYPSEAILELQPPDKGEVLLPTQGEANTQYMDQLLKTEAAKIVNMQIMLEVVQRPEIKATRYFEWYDSNVAEAADGLKDDLICSPIPNTQLIRVALSCRDKIEARKIVSTVVDRYIAQHRDVAHDESRELAMKLNETLAQLTGELERKRGEIKRLRETANLPAMEMRREEARRNVVELQIRISDLSAAVAALQAQKNSIQGVDPSRLPLTAEQELIIESDPILRFWRSQVENLDVEILSLADRLGENHRDVVMLKQRRFGYSEKEVNKREELMMKVRERQIEMLDQQIAQTQSMLMRLMDQLGAIQAEERDLDRNLLTYKEMLDDEERLGKQIGDVEQRKTEAEHLQRAESRVRMHLIQPPQEAIEPNRPNFKLYLIGGIFLAIAGGIALAFLREFTDQVLRTPLDVARFCRLSVLGCIPMLDDEETEIEAIEHAVKTAPQSLIAEAFRRTRTNLQFSGPLETQRTLLITSPSPGDGKTSIAINMATTMAHNNLRVLLIDCNFRRPAIREIFRNTKPQGLSNLLIGEGKLNDYVTKTDLPGMDVLTTGPMPPTPAELLGSTRMKQIIKEAAEHYDHILLDGPPTLLISDATVMAQLVDGVILVVRSDENTRGTLKRARDQLEAIKARVVGAILNGVKVRAGGYFKQQYREFYDYTSDQTIPAELPAPTDPDQKKS